MKRICFLSCQDLDGHIVDDHLAQKELEKHGEYQVDWINWDEETDWKRFDLAIIRTTWDYHKRSAEFLSKLNVIASQTTLMNPASIVEWNFHKGYLKDLANKGVAIVPTVFFKDTESILLPASWNYQRFIIKPAISANAYKTVIIAKEDLLSGKYKTHLAAGDWLLQPFMEEIKQGEVSLHFFNKTFSHGITKTPKVGDFRVQEEHGGLIQNYTPSPELLSIAHNILTQIPSQLLYARVDLVFWQGQWVLMEVELIEPSLYFRMDPQSVVNYKRAIDQHFQSTLA